MRKVTEARVDVELAVGVEPRRVQTDASLEVPVHPDPRRARVPPVAVHVLEGVAMSRARDETTRLVRDRIVRRVGEGAERIAADVGTRRVDVVLRAGRAVLE